MRSSSRDITVSKSWHTKWSTEYWNIYLQHTDLGQHTWAFLPMDYIQLIISEAENLLISLENHPGLYPIFRKSLPFIVSGTEPMPFFHRLKCSWFRLLQRFKLHVHISELLLSIKTTFVNLIHLIRQDL